LQKNPIFGVYPIDQNRQRVYPIMSQNGQKEEGMNAKKIVLVAVVIVVAFVVGFYLPFPQPSREPVDLGNGVFFIRGTEGKTLANFLREHPKLKVGGMAVGTHGWLYGYVVVCEKK